MANFENIRRYAEFNHEAGLDGGIDNHLENIKNAAKMEGAMEERENFVQYIAGIAIAAIGIWEVGKKLFCLLKQFIKRRQAAKREELRVRSAESEAAIRTGVKEAVIIGEEEQITPMDADQMPIESEEQNLEEGSILSKDEDGESMDPIESQLSYCSSDSEEAMNGGV